MTKLSHNNFHANFFNPLQMKNFVADTLLHIAQLQSRGTPYFPEGIFPTYRSNPYVGYSRPDTTLFFSALVAFTLRSLREQLSADSAALVEQLTEKVVANYPNFRNKDGLDTYNFWMTKPSRHFPNGHVFRHFEHFRIPDDVDDTALVYLTTQPTATQLAWLKNKLSQHANGTKQWIQNTYPEYRLLPAYSTWFGKKMYIEFDACVLSNLLYCLTTYRLPHDEYDTASYQYIRSVIETDRYIKEPFRCAHQYPRTPLIVYHVARLIAAHDPLLLRPIVPKLIADTHRLLSQTTHPMDQVLLSTSLLRLGEKPPKLAVERLGKADFEGFYFFIAGLLTAYEQPLLYQIAPNPLFHMRWTCEAHCWALLVEYDVLRQSAAD